MKVKTITCHEVYNYGASLQEYALIEFLRLNGFAAEAINYKPPYLSGHFKLWAISNDRYKGHFSVPYLLGKLPGRLFDLKRKWAFDSFHKKYIPTGSTVYKNNEELKNSLPDADAFICGSDQIWNTLFENGKDPAFYLNFVPNEKLKISYAASFATDSVDEELVPFVYDNVKKLDFIGVRESSGTRILADMGIENSIQVLDPVFLLKSNHWMKFISPVAENYIFVYDFDSNPLIEQIAKDLKKKTNCKIFAMNRNITYADRNFYRHGPEVFLSLVYYSKLNLTNSFHSLAFSLIFEKEVRVFNRSENINTRMRDLLGLFGLEKFLLTRPRSNDDQETIISDELKMKIHNESERSRSFLLNALRSARHPVS